MTIKAALIEAKEALTDAHIESAALDAAILLSHALHISRSQLAVSFDKTIDDKTSDLYKNYIECRAGGECSAYITGHKEFRYLDFLVDKAVLVPRPETETLVEAALECIDRGQNKAGGAQKITVLDLCTGSGAIALSLCHERPNIEMTASDISKPALRITKKNYHHCLLHSPPPTTHYSLHFIQSDLFQNITGTFDIIVSNPPYIAHEKIKTLSREVQNEPHLALDGGPDGLDLIRKIIVDAKEHLSPNGTLLIEADPGQMTLIAEYLTKAGYKNSAVKKDLAGADRVITATNFCCT
jgi:release factor glutamine methyltransferase